MGLLDGQTDKESWTDPETGLLFHNAQYNWNNLPPEPTPQVQTITKPTFEEYVVEPDRSTFTDITPNKDKLTDTQFNNAMQEIGMADVVKNVKKPNNKADYMAKLNAVNTGLRGINQFFHGVIDKEFDGGFMGFNPMNSMAHNAIGEHMRMYSDPDRITETMINNTRRMILEKAGSKLGPQKTQYILERFNQYVQQVKAYKGTK